MLHYRDAFTSWGLGKCVVRDKETCGPANGFGKRCVASNQQDGRASCS
ncbi:hypothetical protein SAMN05421753_111165 [Planctomicrobium piriforme]|uniref:Uncharacterized protein n=1 Tax=Planctomicrobium piriforme TaxID=1576369 RepID=A0A1I3KAK2_9PLAN|nr:hypothetical protein SAMN05421753_111165 [Planctomicrobium piriforme]